MKEWSKAKKNDKFQSSKKVNAGGFVARLRVAVRMMGETDHSAPFERLAGKWPLELEGSAVLAGFPVRAILCMEKATKM